MMRTRLAGMLSVALLAALMAAPTFAATPSRQMALGVTMLPDQDITVFQDFTASVGGHAPAIWNITVPWGASVSGFPDTAFLDAMGPATVPMITWQPVKPGVWTHNPYRYKPIMLGKFDAYIKSFARQARDWGGRVLLRFAHEMDGYWFPWSVQAWDNTPKNFKAAWRHIHRIFQNVGAKNVKFLWSPNQPCGRRCTPYSKIYPGDSYVDYVGFTAFNWGKPRPWLTMVQTLRKGVEGLMAVTKKRIIVTETGSSNRGGDKVAWIRGGYPSVYRKWPRVLAIVYFNVDARTDEQPDWRLTTSNGVLDAYREIVSRVRFQRLIR